MLVFCFFCKQKTAYEMRISDWSSDVCSSDLTPIPADKSNYGMFTVLEDLSKKRTQKILEAAEKDPNSKIGNAFASYLDEATVEAKGLTPIKPWLEEIKGLSSKADYALLAAKANRNGVDGPFGAFVGQDDKDHETYILSFYQLG